MSWMTFAEFAKHRGVSRAYISKIKNRGMLNGALVQRKGEKYPRVDSRKADQILDSNQDPNFTKGSGTDQIKSIGKGGNGGAGSARPPATDTKDQSFLDARIETEKYKAADRKLAFEIKSGKWILKADVFDQAFKAGRIFRDSLLNVGPRIASIVAGEKNEEKCLEIIHKELLESLDEMSSLLSKLGE